MGAAGGSRIVLAAPNGPFGRQPEDLGPGGANSLSAQLFGQSTVLRADGRTG